MIEILFSFVVGAGMGSFAGAAAWRLYLQQEATKPLAKRYRLSTGRSMCETCEKQLSLADLLPIVSWLMLRGKCRYCGVGLPWFAPLVEVMSGLGLAGLVWFFLLEPSSVGVAQIVNFGFWLVYLVGFATLFVYDIRWQLIPNLIIRPLIYLAVGQMLVNVLFFDGGSELVRDSLFGWLFGGGLFYALHVGSGGKWIGGGDVRLGFFLGIVLGAELAGLALFLSFSLASALVLPLLAAKKITRKSRVAFGPFMMVATFIALIAGDRLIDWYIGFAGL